jgi:asparagine synthase (glutamine-hydrolysing)
VCGIAGFAGVALPSGEASTRVRSMCDAIEHRGPDSAGYFVNADVALGMRRLSIIDVAGGTQPIFNEDRTVAVVFNGEIYNHRALRSQLQARGHLFQTHSDTEVLVHLYEDHGAQLLPMLHGMFAFAIWDLRRKTLLVGRDRTGMKPLSYAESDSGVVFCSELRSLLAFDAGLARVAPSAVTQFLAFGYVPDPVSIFSGVRKLRPGHYFTWGPGQSVKEVRYWAPPIATEPRVSGPELVETLRAKLDAAVASHLESEVPLGAFLSGGLDSSTVVGLMARHAAGRVKTFSIGFAETQYDESSAAREVARHFGTDHTDLIVRPKVAEMFEAIAGMFDEPFADASAIPTFLVAQLARQSVTVALSGDGGDELFGGYTRYTRTLANGVGPPSAVSKLIAAIGLTLPHFFPGRNRLIDRGRSAWGRYTATLVEPTRVDEGGVVRSQVPGGTIPLAQQLSDFIAKETGDDFAASMMRVDLQSYLPGDILTKVDRTSMAVSLEARVPLLDFDLVDFALQIPGHLRVNSHETKRLFRQAIRGIVPDAVLSRPKRGFEVPLGQWFRGPLEHHIEALRKLSPGLEDYVDQRVVNRLVREHSVGRRDHGGLLWKLMVLDHWFNALRAGSLARRPSVPRVLLA